MITHNKQLFCRYTLLLSATPPLGFTWAPPNRLCEEATAKMHFYDLSILVGNHKDAHFRTNFPIISWVFHAARDVSCRRDVLIGGDLPCQKLRGASLLAHTNKHTKHNFEEWFKSWHYPFGGERFLGWFGREGEREMGKERVCWNVLFMFAKWSKRSIEMQEVYILPLKKPGKRHLSRLSKKSNIRFKRK